jgi:hypothetical protein
MVELNRCAVADAVLGFLLFPQVLFSISAFVAQTHHPNFL